MCGFVRLMARRELKTLAVIAIRGTRLTQLQKDRLIQFCTHQLHH